jgi:hypothetical protein
MAMLIFTQSHSLASNVISLSSSLCVWDQDLWVQLLKHSMNSFSQTGIFPKYRSVIASAKSVYVASKTKSFCNFYKEKKIKSVYGPEISLHIVFSFFSSILYRCQASRANESLVSNYRPLIDLNLDPPTAWHQRLVSSASDFGFYEIRREFQTSSCRRR